MARCNSLIRFIDFTVFCGAVEATDDFAGREHLDLELAIGDLTDPARDLYQSIRCDGRPSWYPGCALAERAR